jgi:isoprenylcysteine carboxyl methyltransferase (ICMT) family protein YpbQ
MNSRNREGVRKGAKLMKSQSGRSKKDYLVLAMIFCAFYLGFVVWVVVTNFDIIHINWSLIAISTVVAITVSVLRAKKR